MQPIPFRYVSTNLTSTAGANDSLIAVRVVPAGRRGNTVLGRSLLPGEPDSGEPILFNPYAGEELQFPAGSLHVTIQDIDRHAPKLDHGYAAISNTIWTWLFCGAPPNPALFRFLFAAGRRLDTAHSLLLRVNDALDDRDEPFVKVRQRLFDALGLAELLCVAFSRAVDMLQALSSKFALQVSVPVSITGKLSSLKEIRNAFEHIEDRAEGHVRGKPNPDALSIFDQKDLVTSRILRYANHSLDLAREVPPMLVDGRRVLFDAAVAAAGVAKTINHTITYPPALEVVEPRGTPLVKCPGSFERVRERAYFLWENRQGREWWDADSNWREAEEQENAEFRSRKGRVAC